MRITVVVDAVNDFVTGALPSEEAQKAVPRIVQLLEDTEKVGGQIVFLQDTHGEDYLNTLEGKLLPVVHSVKGTWGWEIVDELKKFVREDRLNVLEKNTFGCMELHDYILEAVRCMKEDPNRCGETLVLAFCGFDTDICVISNILIAKATVPDSMILLYENCCAGSTPEKHEAAIKVAESCQIEIV